METTTTGTTGTDGFFECLCADCVSVRPERGLNRAERKPHPRNKKTRRKSLPLMMTLAAAGRIAGSLGRNTKMPGWNYGLDAFQCIRGEELSKIPGSVCSDCYARKNFYKYWRPALIARERRMAGIDHPRWEDAMVELLHHRCRPTDDWFRWHGSGDLMSVAHLARVVRVCERTPWVHHWLPTHEPFIIRDYLRDGGSFPSNLVVRISADMIDGLPMVLEGIEHLPTSTVHTKAPIQVSALRRHSIECLAPLRGNECGNCRACWSTKVRSVSYRHH